MLGDCTLGVGPPGIDRFGVVDTSYISRLVLVRWVLEYSVFVSCVSVFSVLVRCV